MISILLVLALLALPSFADSVTVGGSRTFGGNVKLVIRSVPPNNVLLVKGQQIATREDGLHALVVGGDLPGDPVTKMWVRTWTTANDVQYYNVPGWFTFDFNSPAIQFVGTNRLVIVSPVNGGAGPVRVNEFTIGETTLTSDLLFSFGSSRNRMDGESCRLTNGGAIFVSHEQDSVGSQTNAIQASVVYRPPPAPGDTTNAYQLLHINASGYGTELPTRIAINQTTNGIVHLFWGADSYGAFGMARFTVTNGLSLIDITDPILNEANPDLAAGIGPSGEHPRNFSAADGNRILLCYQNYPHTAYTNCTESLGGGQIVQASKPVITAIAADKSKSMVHLFDWDDWHASHPYEAIWPRSSGIYFLVEKLDTNACTLSWRRGFYQYSDSSESYVDIGDGGIEAYANDGWVCFQDVDGFLNFFKVNGT